MSDRRAETSSRALCHWRLPYSRVNRVLEGWRFAADGLAACAVDVYIRPRWDLSLDPNYIFALGYLPTRKRCRRKSPPCSLFHLFAFTLIKRKRDAFDELRGLFPLVDTGHIAPPCVPAPDERWDTQITRTVPSDGFGCPTHAPYSSSTTSWRS